MRSIGMCDAAPPVYSLERKSPYDLHGLQLPTRDWWELLRWTPQQLRQHLQGANATAAEPLLQKVSGLEVAA